MTICIFAENVLRNLCCWVYIKIEGLGILLNPSFFCRLPPGWKFFFVKDPGPWGFKIRTHFQMRMVLIWGRRFYRKTQHNARDFGKINKINTLTYVCFSELQDHLTGCNLQIFIFYFCFNSLGITRYMML